MKTYSEKLQENKSSAAHNTSSKSNRSVPAFKSPTVLQPRFNESGKSYPAVVQLYKEGPGNSKLSGGEQLLWQNPAEVYAGDTQFSQANSISNSQVVFKKGPAHSVLNYLNFVDAQAKPESQLDKETKNFDIEKEGDIARQELFENFESDLLQDFLEQHDEELELIDKTDDEDGTNRVKREIELEKIVKKTAPSEFEESGPLNRLKEYLEANKLLEDRPLMRSNCYEMAKYVAGFDPKAGVKVDEYEAGNVYEIPPAQGAEWNFHYATIIMTDGPDDHMTMENAGAKVSSGFTKLKYDKTWMFKIYGPDNGQSFDDEYAEPMGHK